MNKIVAVVFTLLIIAVASKVSAQSEEKRQVSGYNIIQSSGPFNVHIKIDGTESLRITGPSEILKETETIVDDGKLEIKFKHHYNWNHGNTGNQSIDVYITAKLLSGLAESGSGAITLDGALSGDKVSVILSGSGSVMAAVKSGDLNVAISGSGSIDLNGNASDATIALTGSGALNAKGLMLGTVSIAITGSGNAYVSADKSISGRIVGSGNVIYTGNASVTSIKTLGSGRINKAE
jgi:hypothetical protein